MPGKTKNLLFGLLVVFISVSVSLAVAEFVTRHYFPVDHGLEFSGKELVYRFDPELGWAPRPDALGTFTFQRTVSIKNNHAGFRDHEIGPKTKPRLVVVGDSFVWGYDVEENERMTNQLQQLLPNWEVVNLGVSGYSTDQQLLLLKRNIVALQPDIVLTVFCIGNDFDDNQANSHDLGLYSKPYFTVQNGALTLHNVPVPKSPNYYYSKFPMIKESQFLVRLFTAIYKKFVFKPVVIADPTKEILRDMKSLAENHGAKFAVAFTGHYREYGKFINEYFDGKIREILADLKIPALSLETDMIFETHFHWNVEGNKWAAARVRDFLRPWLQGSNELLKSSDETSECSGIVSKCRHAGFAASMIQDPEGQDLMLNCIGPLILKEKVKNVTVASSEIAKCIGVKSAIPCLHLIKTCETHGYKQGAGLLAACLLPMAGGEAVPNVTFDADDLKQCRRLAMTKDVSFWKMIYRK